MIHLTLPIVAYAYASENPASNIDVLGLFDAGSAAAAAARHGTAICKEAGSMLGGAILSAIVIAMHASDANPASFEGKRSSCDPCNTKKRKGGWTCEATCNTEILGGIQK